MRRVILSFIVSVVVEHRIKLFIIAGLVTAAALVGASQLSMDTRWSALLPPGEKSVKEYNYIDEHFMQPGEYVIAVSGEDTAVIERITDEVTALLKKEIRVPVGADKEDYIKNNYFAKEVYGKMPEDFLVGHMFPLLKPSDARKMRDLYRDPSVHGYLTHLNDMLEEEFGDEESMSQNEREAIQSLNSIESFLKGLDAARDKRLSKEETDRIIRDITTGSPYSISLDGGMSLIMVPPSLTSFDSELMVNMDKYTEKLLEPIQKKYPEYRIERTGMVAIGRDEMDSVGPVTMVISLMCLVLVYFLLAWNFRSFLIPLIGIAPITVGIIWAMGFLGITIGKLNIVTVMMTVVLMGLGIDFSIHIASRFFEERLAGAACREAISKSIERTGKGIITGALTTSAAFLALMIADARAIREFGFCAGSGIIFTLLAALILLPALLAAVYGKRDIRNTQSGSSPVRFAVSIAEYAAKHRVPAAVLFILIFIIGIFSMKNIQWEWNFMNLEPENLRSVELQDEIVDRFRLSPTSSMVTVGSIEESRKLAKNLKGLRGVGEVNDISQWVSRPDFTESREYIRDLRGMLNEEVSPFDITTASEELERLWDNIVEMQALALTSGQDRIFEKAVMIVSTRDARDTGMLQRISESYASEDFDSWILEENMAALAGALHDRLIAMSASDKAVTEEMVPADIAAQFKGRDNGRYLVHILPKKNLYDKDSLYDFRDSVSSVTEGVTGTPQMIIMMNESTLRDGAKAMGAAFLVIFLLLLADYRNLIKTVVTVVPLAAGISLTLFVMFITKSKFNYINMIALPVIIGIGVDDGVHLLHRLSEEGTAGIGRAVLGSGRAMLMTSLTTMIGFGSMMFYLMRGMASLGFVLFFGVGFCFLATVFFVPAFSGIFPNIINSGMKTETKAEKKAVRDK